MWVPLPVPRDHETKPKQQFLAERSLDGVAGKHLLAKVVLVLANGAVPSPGCLVLADHNVLGNLVEKSVTWVSELDL